MERKHHVSIQTHPKGRVSVSFSTCEYKSEIREYENVSEKSLSRLTLFIWNHEVYKQVHLCQKFTSIWFEW